MSPWEKLLEQPHCGGHFVQLYQAGESALTQNVGQFLGEGLRRGDGVLVIATAEHRELFSRHLERSGADIPSLCRRNQLVLLDAQETLAKFMIGGRPDWQRFEQVICGALRQVRRAEGCRGFRAYGEMVGLLWNSRQVAAAIRLEQLWNKLLEQSFFTLYCAYAIDVFGTEFQLANVEGVLCTHTHLVPSTSNGTLETAVNRSLDEFFASHADALRVQIRSGYNPAWAVLPDAERMILGLRKKLPEQADEIIGRVRQHYLRLSQTGSSLQ